MQKKKECNPNIGCDVQQCKYHCKGEDCCSLQRIDVHQESRAAKDEHCTCCHSFACE